MSEAALEIAKHFCESAGCESVGHEKNSCPLAHAVDCALRLAVEKIKARLLDEHELSLKWHRDNVDLAARNVKLKNQLNGARESLVWAEEQVTALKARLEKAKNYKGVEGWQCPLCEYENGVFIKNCEPHKQLRLSMLAEEQALQEAKKWRRDAQALGARNVELKAELDEAVEDAGRYEMALFKAEEGRDAAVHSHAATEAILAKTRKSLAERDRQLAIAVMALEKMVREVIC